MTYVLDTNIILSTLLNDKFDQYFERTYRKESDNLVLSVVSEGELHALALKRNWGNKRVTQLLTVIRQYLIYPVKVQQLIGSYAYLDAYSQNKLVNKPMAKKFNARNMGKNDLWIAATAHVLSATLITTDKDFEHLNGTFFPIEFIDMNSFL